MLCLWLCVQTRNLVRISLWISPWLLIFKQISRRNIKIYHQVDDVITHLLLRTNFRYGESNKCQIPTVKKILFSNSYNILFRFDLLGARNSWLAHQVLQRSTGWTRRSRDWWPLHHVEAIHQAAVTCPRFHVSADCRQKSGCCVCQSGPRIRERYGALYYKKWLIPYFLE